MNETQQSTNTKRRSCCGCWLYGILICVGLPLFIVFALAMVFMGRENSARRELQARLMQRLAENLPVDNESLTEFHSRATSNEQTAKWLSVLNRISTREFEQASAGIPMVASDATVPAPGREWNERTKTLEFLHQQEVLINELHELTQQQLDAPLPVRIPIRFQSLETDLSQQQLLRNVARLLNLAGQTANYEGDSAGVHKNTKSLLGLSETLKGEPILVSQLIRIAIANQATDLLRRALESDVLTESDLQELLPLFATRVSMNNSWSLALNGEIAAALPVFQSSSKVINNPDIPNLPARSRDALLFLDHMESALRVPTSDLGLFREEMEKLDEELNTKLNAGYLPNVDGIMTGILVPAVNAVGDAFVREVTMHRQAAIGIALRLYERQYGELPETLDELEPILGMAIEQLAPPAASRFGYAIDEEGAILWGYDYARVDTLPASPLPKPAESDESVEALMQRMWTWYLPQHH